ncbi:MAG: NAD(P)/FAD-dependent oxidoreductase [Gemmatimonadetes bacterium]|nr:NAD(P)/FAD-dependent oxidoreductase [Gemmatimonadota bacterium]
MPADVLIVGAGPAGCTLAGLLAPLGWDVLILERTRFPRHKPCGECVNPGGVAALERLGLLDVVLAAGPARITGWRIHSPAGDLACGRYNRERAVGIGLPRERLDQALAVEAVRRGARIEEGVRMTGFEVDGNGCVVVRAIGPGGRAETLRTRLLVGADGLRSVVARRAGLTGRGPKLRKLSLTCRLRGSGPPADAGTLFLADWGVFGLAPVSGDGLLWNGTLVVDSTRYGRRVGTDPIAFYRDAVSTLPLSWNGGAPRIEAGPWASGPFDRPTRSAVGNCCVLVGDAAGYYDPLTGQGIYQALRSAELAAPVIDAALRKRSYTVQDLVPYDCRLRRELAPGRRVQRAIEMVVARPGLRDRVVRRLAAAPTSTDALIAVTGDVARVRRLLQPRAWLPAVAGVGS